MATTNYPAFDAGLPPLELHSAPVTSDADKTTPQSPHCAEFPGANILRVQGREAAGAWILCPSRERLPILAAKWKNADRSIRKACRKLTRATANAANAASNAQWLLDGSSLLYQALLETHAALQGTHKLRQVVAPEGQRLPRAYAAAESYLRAARWQVDSSALQTFLEGVQEDLPFTDAELSLLRPFLELVVLESIGAFAETLSSGANHHTPVSSDRSYGLMPCLRNLVQLGWKEVFETISVMDRTLRQDPLATYGSMDDESRGQYRRAVVRLAARSSWSESDVARKAVELAHGPHRGASQRAKERRSHVGYFLLDAGQDGLKRAIGYHPPIAERIRESIRKRPTFFYLATIALATCGIFGSILDWLRISGSTNREFLIAAILLLPAMACAIGVTNLLATHVVKPQRFPRLDFTKGIPTDCATLVAIPMLLINEEQVRQAARDLEIRYLANRDRNLHFALVTDPPDSLKPVDERDALAEICSALIQELNDKYSRSAAGSFLHLHRRRAHNATEGIWMGWERKRGKMLDLNNLLLNRADHFPVKAGNPAVLGQIRYVIALDQDTQLPRDSARKLVGALAHPLNRAVTDPATNRVVEGYAILQPRVAISIKAKNRSRFASICSGDTGFDLYTRAVSDVYQDLFGSGIYTGKGIYEVETFQKLLEHRFPCNVILSHDLIEGSYARAGLISDIEVVDDYPSHISAYSRRKHRWVRGDWQIILWLFPRVPESFGKLVPNPLSLLSRWQIIDNLRRSLAEFASLALLLCSWLVMPGRALYGTLAALALMVFPTYFEFFISLAGAGRRIFSALFWKSAGSDLVSKHLNLLCRIALLCHQCLVALDAVARAIVRMTVTHKRLLEWETAAQAELKTREKTPVEAYLDWTPAAAVLIAAVVSCLRPSSLPVALPFLMLWGTSKAVCDWLAHPYTRAGKRISPDDQRGLRHMALRTWRFFSEFSTEQDNWLIPDVVQMDPSIVVHSISPTNLGLLLNARLAALDLGFLTLAEFVSTNEKTMEAVGKLPTLGGHFYNWYDTRTLAPLSPRFVSTVDNGNLICCLWTLKEACLELKHQPVFRSVLWEGVLAHLNAIEAVLGKDSLDETLAASLRDLRHRVDRFSCPGCDWRKTLPKLCVRISTLERTLCAGGRGDDIEWWAHALAARLRNLEDTVRDSAPWLLPEFSTICDSTSLDLPDFEELTPDTLEPVLTKLLLKLDTRLDEREIGQETDPIVDRFREALCRSRAVSRSTLERLNRMAMAADRLVNALDFSSFYSSQKRLLSIGYDCEARRLCDCHYDLLASEARSAVFVAIAKGDIPQDAWSQLGRSRASVNEQCVLLSWTGTLFEYLMPTLWMKSYPNTLLEQAARASILVQKSCAEAKAIPWGISESSCAERDTDGRYGYRAFGAPELALSRLNRDDLVVSPYSTFLALMADAAGATENLREMEKRGWLGAYGFYEACDFTPSHLEPGKICEVVACWMAHHQGMSLVATTNALCDSSMQRRFHAEPMVAATERLLQETARDMTVVDPDERSRLDWLKTSVPVLRNFWQTAFPAPRESLELPPERFRDAD